MILRRILICLALSLLVMQHGELCAARPGKIIASAGGGYRWTNLALVFRHDWYQGASTVSVGAVHNPFLRHRIEYYPSERFSLGTDMSIFSYRQNIVCKCMDGPRGESRIRWLTVTFPLNYRVPLADRLWASLSFAPGWCQVRRDESWQRGAPEDIIPTDTQNEWAVELSGGFRLSLFSLFEAYWLGHYLFTGAVSPYGIDNNKKTPLEGSGTDMGLSVRF